MFPPSFVFLFSFSLSGKTAKIITFAFGKSNIKVKNKKQPWNIETKKTAWELFRCPRINIGGHRHNGRLKILKSEAKKCHWRLSVPSQYSKRRRRGPIGIWVYSILRKL